MQAWAGLGYYSRARNLHACARARRRAPRRPLPRHRGGLAAACPASAPTRRRRSRRSPSISRAAAVDGNVERVVSRLFARRDAAAEGKARDPRPRRGAGAGRAARRFRAGDDGSRRHDLHAEAPGLRALPVARRLPGARRRACRRRCRARPEGGRRAAPRRRLRGAARATTRSCCGRGRRRACSAAWTRCRRAPGRRITTPPAGDARRAARGALAAAPGPRPPRLHAFPARADGAPREGRGRNAGAGRNALGRRAARSPGRRCPASCARCWRMPTSLRPHRRPGGGDPHHIRPRLAMVL